MLKNAKDWKTTTLGIVAGVLVIAGIMWPEKIDANTQMVANEAFTQIITGIEL